MGEFIHNCGNPSNTLVNPRCACAARVTVVVVWFCLSVKRELTSTVIDCVKTRSHTQWQTEVRKIVGFSLKLLRCKARAIFCSYARGAILSTYDINSCSKNKLVPTLLYTLHCVA